MPKWTNDQNEAIISRGSNLLVSAAAGSGKTAVLVERIIQLIIQSKVNIDEMLIVTFTNAAASEMRERIVGALYEQLEKDNDPFLREQVDKVGRASIMTLHAFCIGVVRNNAHFIDVDPGFKIGDTVELNIIAAEAMEEILETAYEAGTPEFERFVEAYSENRQDKKIVDLIQNTYNFIQSQPKPIEWLDETVHAFDESAKYLDLLHQNIAFDLVAGMQLLEQASVIVESPDGPLEYDEMIQNDLLHISDLVEALNDWDDFIQQVNSIKHMRLKAIKKDRKEEIDGNLIEEVKALRDGYKGIIKEIQGIFENKTIEDYLEDIKAVQPYMFTLFELVKSYTEAYSLAKLDRNLLDFNDLEHYALKALEHEEVQSYYRNKYAYIFLDEYQDSNLVQETLVQQIKRENNVFLVGDVKQSIYKFRLADPTLFMSKYTSYKKEAEAVDRRIDLKKNFRSRAEILEGINFIFESLMSKSFGEMTYDDDAKLYTGIDFGEIEDPSIDVEIIEGKYEGHSILEEMNAAEVEAKAVARQIKNLIGKKSYDRKKDEYFDIAYKDIVILMRAISAWSPVFNDVFLKEGIPVFADASGGYFDAIEIKMFVSLLRIIDNPHQDIPLLTVLRSSIFNFSMDELIQMRIEKQDGKFYEAFFNCTDESIKEKVDKTKLQLEEWRQAAKYQKLDELLWSIMIETGYYQYVGAMPGGKSRQGNLRLLIDRAEQMEKVNHNALHQFINMVDKMHKTNTEMGTAKIIGEAENVVRIMSIHKSKGLEFPVVILCAMGKKFNLRDAYQDVLLHKQLGIGPKYVDPIHRVTFDTLPKKLIKRQIRLENLSEEMRVLYVALTRAVDKLIMIGTVKNLENHSKKWTRGKDVFNLMSAQSYLDWLMMILSTHPVSKPIWALAEKSYLGLSEHITKFNINFVKRDDLYDVDDEGDISARSILSDIDKYQSQVVNEVLEERFNYEYPYQLHELPSKFSVTELKKLAQGDQLKFEPLNTTPKFLQQETKKNAAEIGTLMHFIMQKLDRHNDDIKGQINKMVQTKTIKEEELKYVKEEKFKKFFESDLGKRYIQSTKVEKEKPFVLKKKLEMTGDDEVLVQGIIDCYFEEVDGYVLIDYKTDYIYGDGQILAERYEAQLNLYKEAIERMTGKLVKETYIYSFYQDKSIKV